MKQNITLSIEKDLIQKGKVIAAKNNTSISRMLGDLLKEITEKGDAYEAAKRKALGNLKKGFHSGGNVTWKREDLYER